MYLFNLKLSNLLFKTLPQSFYIAQPQKKDMASGTPSVQVRVPVGDLIFPPPHLCLHYTTWGKNIRRRKFYLVAEQISRAGAGGPKIRKENFGKTSQ